MILMSKLKPTKKVTYRRHDGREAIPAIIIEGTFLKRLGFHVGDTAHIVYERGRITITKPNQQAYALQHPPAPQSSDFESNHH